MQPAGFTVYIIADMEGLAGVVNNSVEMRPSYRGGTPEHERFRQELTDEVNAAIAGAPLAGDRDRKSTRLNSSHLVISYAVFCLKKKKKKEVWARMYAVMYSTDILQVQLGWVRI